MLVHLHVKNLALIEEIEVEFGPGLNILTGETGAGKSILLGSMQLILGGKISRGMIRENASYALVELLFQVENEKARQALLELDIIPEDGQVLLSRKLMEGRSVSKINGETCTVGQMKAAAACLLDIHGQHEHQSLLYPEKQLEILDAYGKEKIQPLEQKVKEAYGVYRECEKNLKALDMDGEQRKREQAFLEFEIQEIQKAQLKEGEDQELEIQYRKLGNSRKIVETLQNVHRLCGYEDGAGAGEQVGNALRELSRVAEYDPELLEMENSLTALDGLLNDFNRDVSFYLDGLTFDETLFYETERRLDLINNLEMENSLTALDGLLNDFNRDVSFYLDGLTFDETLFYETERRLDLINNLKSKYGQTLDEIFSYEKEQQQKLEKLLKYEEISQKAREDLEIAETNLEQASYALSEIRKEYSRQLKEKIIEGLKDLNFLDVDFDIHFERKKNFTERGYDAVEYEISTNPGESLKPLGKIVSGGELSRIMLALKAILADRDQIETLIFDEIDTGISGRTAQKVSEKMAVIGRHHQVLCITHLPQIAAMADTHFEIEKQIHGTETMTQIHPLNEEKSIHELARLLGGARITDAVLENAREMKELAQVHKNTRLK